MDTLDWFSNRVESSSILTQQEEIPFYSELRNECHL